MRFLTASLLFLSALHSIHAQKAWIFAYFKEPANQGIYFAISHDGYHFTALYGDQPCIQPEQPGEIMRDVFLTRGPDHKFRMVWTWGWHGNSLGYAESDDLIHWSTQREIPIMQDHPATRNVWAPEIYWDARRRLWLVLWSSSMNGSDSGNRIWSSFTSDFKNFSTPKIFFDPGYVVIDATLFHWKKKYYLVFKDQTPDPLRYQIRFATGPTLEGPWKDIHPPITESWSEGPSVVHPDDNFIVYYDHYRAPVRYEAVQSADWRHWVAINERISLPPHCKHGSFLEISAKEAARLEASLQPR